MHIKTEKYQSIISKGVLTWGAIIFTISFVFAQSNLSYPIVDTDQLTFFSNTTLIEEPLVGSPFYGQDASYSGFQPSYTDNGDGTVTDNVTGLMWQQTLDQNGDGVIDYDDKLPYDEILDVAQNATTGGYTDWRLPTIKEQYSLILFSGRDISGYEGTSTDGLIPFLDDDVFGFAYGDESAGERLIDVQLASTDVYVGSTEIETLIFGVNFADGRIKGYGSSLLGQDKFFNYLLVRGATDYGVNDFEDNGDGTITDNATGLMWMQDDNGEGVVWQDALTYAEGFEYGGHSDWRLPNIKELQSILDYTRSPATDNTAAIDPLFNCTEITNEDGQIDYPYYWSGTTHGNWTQNMEGAWAAYMSFGRALGYDQMSPNPSWRDVHGAGAQRSDPKVGDPSEYPTGHGPQGDAIRIYNYVRLVRGGDVSTALNDVKVNQYKMNVYPNPATTEVFVSAEKELDLITVYNVNGQKVLERYATRFEESIDVSRWNDGVYIIRAVTEDEDLMVKRVVVGQE